MAESNRFNYIIKLNRLIAGALAVSLLAGCSSSSDSQSTDEQSSLSSESIDLTLTPSTTSVVTSDLMSVTASGGTPPYTYSVANSLAGTIDPVTGVFRAGSSPVSVVQLVVTDQSTPQQTAVTNISIVSATGSSSQGLGALTVIHRFYSSSVGDHWYATTMAKPANYSYEMPAFQVYAGAPSNSSYIPLYACVYQSVHHFLSNDSLCEGQLTEALFGYLVKYTGACPSGTQPLYRFFNARSNDHLATLNDKEAINAKFKLESILGCAVAP